MSRTYKAVGINLKGMPLGESDRLLTILTPEFGLIRAVAPGARKHKSSLGGRSGLFVVNELLIAKGRSLDKITQAQSLESYPGLGQHLGKLTASQYLAELVLLQALGDQPQRELYELFNAHLGRLEQAASNEAIMAHLTHAVFHLLALAGLAPQVHRCCTSQDPIVPDFQTPHWQVEFDVAAGGAIAIASQQTQPTQDKLKYRGGDRQPTSAQPEPSVGILNSPPAVKSPQRSQVTREPAARKSAYSTRLDATELDILQRLAYPELPIIQEVLSSSAPMGIERWLRLEHILRQYAQYHFDRSLRAAALIESCFLPLPTSITRDNATV
ncbi:MAG: DNA repair protein RecO [Desertifilum sp.]|nr:DNA repair protein RecO [Desertifilum sp.]